VRRRQRARREHDVPALERHALATGSVPRAHVGDAAILRGQSRHGDARAHLEAALLQRRDHRDRQVILGFDGARVGVAGAARLARLPPVVRGEVDGQRQRKGAEAEAAGGPGE
jgi:hypothetical protein